MSELGPRSICRGLAAVDQLIDIDGFKANRSAEPNWLEMTARHKAPNRSLVNGKALRDVGNGEE